MDDDGKPTPKVTAGLFGAGVATVIVGVAVWLGAPDPPVGLEGGIATVVGFAAAYLKEDS